MAHTAKDKKKLLHRVRRLRGQLDAVEAALQNDKDCSLVLLTLSACRGAMDGLMAEIIEGHIEHHILDPEQKPTAEQKRAAQEVITVVRRYLK